MMTNRIPASVEEPLKKGGQNTGSESSHSWISDTISETWSSVQGGARVAAGVATGFVKHVVANPIETAVEVGAGVVAAGAIAEAGIGALGATAIAAVPLAAYGAYRGIDIARTEGIAAIPGHLKQTYNDAMSTASSVGKAVGAVYNGSADSAAMARVESIGDATAPFIAGGIGVSSTFLGRQVIRGAYTGLELLADQVIPRAPQLVPAFVDGLPQPHAALAMLGDLPVASTASLAVGDGSIALHSQSGGGLGNMPGDAGAPRAVDPRVEAIRNESRSSNAEIRFQRAVKRLEAVADRKAEAAERAERIAKDPEAKDVGGGMKVKITEFAAPTQRELDTSPGLEHVTRVEEDSTGRRVTYYGAKEVIDEPDGTRTTVESISNFRDRPPSNSRNTVIEHANGDLEVSSAKPPSSRVYTANGGDITSGSIQHLDGSRTVWQDENLGRATTFEDKDGKITRTTPTRDGVTVTFWTRDGQS